MAVSLEEAVAHLRERIESGARRLAIRAPLGHGKTAVLGGLASALSQQRPVVRVELPDGDDAALVALVEAAIQLRSAEPDILEHVVSQNEPARVPWANKLAALRRALDRAGKDLVLLVDEPRFDVLSTPGTELFGTRAMEITDTLLASPGSVVLAGAFIPPHVAPDAGLRLPLSRDPDDLNMEVISSVMRQPLPHRALPPVVVQLREALRVAGVDVGRIPPRDLRLDRLLPYELGAVLLQRVEMRRVLARFAALRVPFSPPFLESAGFSRLSQVDRDIVTKLLFTADDGALVLPAALSQGIRAQIASGDPAWSLDEPPGEAHRCAAQHHHARFEAARARRDVAVAVREEMEEIHHLTEAGDAQALLTRSLQFVEQYDALGKSLSLKALRDREHEEALRRDAVRAYERALDHEGDDAYAHHYIAYNLDILAVERERVAREYLTAKELVSTHAWYHSRHLCFLITTARMSEAHAAWERALRDLGDTAGMLRPTDYDWLHRRAARLLLARSELKFAAEILEDVPEKVRAAPWWIALDQLRVCLEEDRDERLVFPPTLALAKRWRGPHLVPSGPSDPEISSWRPGRVLGGDEDVLLLYVEEHEGGKLSTSSLETRTLQGEWKVSPEQLSAGTFVELVEYADGTKEMKLWDRQHAIFDEVPNLPRLFPPPDRYIRRAFAAPRG